MTATETNIPQEPVEGSRCLAAPGGGQWGTATIRRVNEDGTFKIEFDVKVMTILPSWNGVTLTELSFADDLLWTDVFARISTSGVLAGDDFYPALAALGIQVTPSQAQQAWAQGCQKLFNLAAGQAEKHYLDEAQSYRLFLHLGLSAKQCAEKLEKDRPQPFFKLYWNQIRMGGREPTEIPRVVTIEDALAALGLDSSRIDPSMSASLHQWEKEQGIHLPAAVKKLLQCEGVASAVMDSHSNSPCLIECCQWSVQRGMRGRQLNGDCALAIMAPHQGSHKWAVVFDDGEDDARVYVRLENEDEESWLLTAPSVGMFFWDLAQTGLAWYQDTKYKGGKLVCSSDIGLVPQPVLSKCGAELPRSDQPPKTANPASVKCGDIYQKTAACVENKKWWQFWK